MEKHRPIWISLLMNYKTPKNSENGSNWRDKIRYWIFASKEVETTKYYSVGQHRGNVGEGQLHFNQGNIGDFEEYEDQSNKLYEAILEAWARQLTNRQTS